MGHILYRLERELAKKIANSKEYNEEGKKTYEAEKAIGKYIWEISKYSRDVSDRRMEAICWRKYPFEEKYDIERAMKEAKKLKKQAQKKYLSANKKWLYDYEVLKEKIKLCRVYDQSGVQICELESIVAKYIFEKAKSQQSGGDEILKDISSKLYDDRIRIDAAVLSWIFNDLREEALRKLYAPD